MKKIAIIRRNGLGDLLCAYPLVLYLQKTDPTCLITLFVDERNASLLPFLPPVDQTIVIPERGNKYWNLFRAARQGRRERFDVAFSAKTSPMKLMNLFLYWLGAKKRVAVIDKSWHSRLINTPLLYDPVEARSLHQALKSLHMVAPGLNAIPEEFYPHVQIPQKLKRTLSFPHLAGPHLLLSISNNRKTSQLDPARQVALLNQLYQTHFFSVLIVGKSGEKAAGVYETLKPPSQLYFPRNFEEFMVCLDLCDLFFVGDGGVAHLGAALGKREVVLHGKTLPAEWAPLNPQATVLFHREHVNGIADEEIYRALEERLEGIHG